MSATWRGLLESLAGGPDLEGAGCTTGKRYELFDVEDADDERAAAARFICSSCPAIQPCRDFADTLRGHRRPPGTLAGVTSAHRPVAPRPSQPKPVRPSVKPRQPRPRVDAAQWLADRLAAGAVAAATVVADGAKAGLSPSALDRARRRIGAVSERLPGRRGAAQWRLECPERTESIEGDPAA